MKAVASGDEVARDLMFDAVFAVADARLVRVEVVDADVRGLVDGGGVGGRARVHQISGHLGLAVDHDVPSGESGEIDTMPGTVEQKVEAAVDQPFTRQAVSHTGTAQQVHHALLQHAGPDPAQHVVGAAVLDHERVNARSMQQLPEQEAGRAGPDDRDLNPRGRQRRPNSL